MKSMEDAIAVCAREKDNFYVTAFMIEAWLGEMTCRTVAEYAAKKLASDRSLRQWAGLAFGALFLVLAFPLMPSSPSTDVLPPPPAQ